MIGSTKLSNSFKRMPSRRAAHPVSSVKKKRGTSGGAAQVYSALSGRDQLPPPSKNSISMKANSNAL